MPPRIARRWRLAERVPPAVAQELALYPPLVRQILYNRGLRTAGEAQAYLEALPPAGNHPYALRGLPEAVERIRFALRHGERIAIYGDYDVDGVAATALLTHTLGLLGGEALSYIPNRFEEGYGLNIEALEDLKAAGVRLVITVDCGMRSPLEAEHARKIGLDLIITDHHTPGPQALPALAVINPKQAGDPYPEKHLAGVGVAYKLAEALLESAGRSAEEYLDLVALGTISDLAPLVGENRHLARRGLEMLRRPHRQGVYSLINAAQIAPQSITAETVSYILGPRLNAAGRLESALAALRLLLTTQVSEAAELAQRLESQNRERQNLTRQIQAQAEQMALEEDPQGLLFFAVHEEFNPGVVGLAASRLVEQYYRPAVVAHRGEEFTRGSCRSVSEFHITRALDQCADLLERYGGHAAAAGFTVRNRHLPELKERLKNIAEQELGRLDLRPTLRADAEVTLAEMHPDLLRYLAWLEPTGHGNPPALFLARHVRVLRSKAVGREGEHLKFAVTDGQVTFDAIAFRQGHWQENLPPYVDLLFQFEVNEYNGRRELQLNVRDLRPAAAE